MGIEFAQSNQGMSIQTTLLRRHLSETKSFLHHFIHFGGKICSNDLPAPLGWPRFVWSSVRISRKENTTERERCYAASLNHLRRMLHLDLKLYAPSQRLRPVGPATNEFPQKEEDHQSRHLRVWRHLMFSWSWVLELAMLVKLKV